MPHKPVSAQKTMYSPASIIGFAGAAIDLSVVTALRVVADREGQEFVREAVPAGASGAVTLPRDRLSHFSFCALMNSR